MALVTFLVMHATPGSPLDPVAEGANPLSPEAQKNLAEAYGLDKPLYEQFAHLRRQGGPRRLRPVLRLQDADRRARSSSRPFPISLLLGTHGPGRWRSSGGLTLGILAAVYQNRGVGLRLGEPGDARRGRAELRAGRLPHHPLLVRHPALPDRRLGLAARLGAADGHAGAGARWASSRASRARACSRSSASDYTLHRARQGARRGARSSSSTRSRTRSSRSSPCSGPMFAAVGTGSFFVESIFRVPGMGRFFVLSMTGRDYPMIMAVVLIYGAFLAVDEPRRRPRSMAFSTPASDTSLARRRAAAGAGAALAARRRAERARASGATPGAGCSATGWRWRAASSSSLLVPGRHLRRRARAVCRTPRRTSAGSTSPPRATTRSAPTSSAATCSRG